MPQPLKAEPSYDTQQPLLEQVLDASPQRTPSDRSVLLDQVLSQSPQLTLPPVTPLPPAKTYEHLGYVGLYDTEAPHWEYWHVVLPLRDKRVIGQFFSDVTLPLDGYWYDENYFFRGVTFYDRGEGNIAFVGHMDHPNIWEQQLISRNRLPRDRRYQIYAFNLVLPHAVPAGETWVEL